MKSSRNQELITLTCIKFRQFINSGVVDLYRPSDNHLSFRGYEIMSEIIFKYLNKNNF